jgi:hypothetical protein
MSNCECLCKLEKNNKELYNELKKAICILKSHIHTLKIYEKLTKKNVCKIIIPISLLALVKNLLYKNKITCCDKHCKCNKEIINPNAHALYKMLIDCDNDSCNNDCNKYKKCHMKFIDISECAIYCDPVTLEVHKLHRKDICPIIKCKNETEFIKSVRLIIAKYEGFIYFFQKIMDFIEHWDTK